VSVYGIKIQLGQGERAAETDLIDCVIVDGEVRSITSLEWLVDRLDESGKLVMPQAEATPLTSLDAGGQAFVGSKAGQTRNDNGLELTVVWCPPGKFRMGTPEDQRAPWVDASTENPVEVELTQGFWIGATEVTREQWQHVMGTKPWMKSTYAREGTGYPVIHALAKDALEFCRKLTGQERDAGRLPAGWEYNLPTEAQWEYACRAGTDTLYVFGNAARDIDEYAWDHANTIDVGEAYPHQVGKKKPNSWGLYDMYGNVDEYCRDVYAKTLSGGVDPIGPAKRGARVVRGGSWATEWSGCRSAARSFEVTDAEINAFQGFRVAVVRAAVDAAAK
jgi:formylglycine-generating enzyme required for sulfatase activity